MYKCKVFYANKMHDLEYKINKWLDAMCKNRTFDLHTVSQSELSCGITVLVTYYIEEEGIQ